MKLRLISALLLLCFLSFINSSHDGTCSACEKHIKCSDLLFSTKCKHAIHQHCYKERIAKGIRVCPICGTNMSTVVDFHTWHQYARVVGIDFSNVCDENKKKDETRTKQVVGDEHLRGVPALLYGKNSVEGAVQGQVFAVQPTVLMTDNFGTQIFQSGMKITASLMQSHGDLAGNVECVTDNDGMCHFTDLAVHGPPGVYRLSFSLNNGHNDDSNYNDYHIEEDNGSHFNRNFNNEPTSESASFLVAPLVDPRPSYKKRVISSSLYGTGAMYRDGAVVNAELTKKLYPGWIFRIYHDGSQPQDLLEKLRSLDVELIDMKAAPPHVNLSVTSRHGPDAGMFWRFLVVDDASVDISINVDSDSRLNLRQKAAVDEWLRSGIALHTMRDSSWHNHPINGGMWGCVRHCVKGMGDMVVAWLDSQPAEYFSDMIFLKIEIWPQLWSASLAHDSSSCELFDDALPFPTPRQCHEITENINNNNKNDNNDENNNNNNNNDNIKKMECECVNRKFSAQGTVHDAACENEWLHRIAPPACRRDITYVRG